MKDTYKGMTGGLFDGRPLEVTRDPSRDIMEITSKYAGSTWVKSLTSLAHRLME